MVAVRRLDRVTVWSPTAANREALAVIIEQKFAIEAIATETLEEALKGTGHGRAFSAEEREMLVQRLRVVMRELRQNNKILQVSSAD